jgi:hypothetical protein
MPNAIPWPRLRRILVYGVLFTLMVWTLHWEHIPPGSFGARLDRIMRGSYFDFVSWETDALLDKLGQELTVPQNYLDDAARKQIVLDYMDLVARIQQVENEIARIYTDPDVMDPRAASVDQRATLAQLRAEQAEVQGTAEAIIQEQIASVLEDEGFGTLGQVLPPVRFRFTPLPYYLVISPRSEITLVRGAMLRGDIELERIEELEAQIDENFDVSSLIVPIGGLAVYPAMMSETTALRWIIGATAHEWVHHYYFFWLAPVGLYYGSRPDVRTINETAANLAGGAIEERVLARYYPELLPSPTPTPDPEAPPVPTPEPPEFDFVTEMRQTRIQTDDLLAAGKVEQAETYMELRRRVFVENGYGLRKLNQAYFAFYGAYASDPGGGAAGANPVGDPVQELWAASASIKDFLETLAPISSREMLLDALADKGIEYPPPTPD